MFFTKIFLYQNIKFFIIKLIDTRASQNTTISFNHSSHAGTLKLPLIFCLKAQFAMDTRVELTYHGEIWSIACFIFELVLQFGVFSILILMFLFLFLLFSLAFLLSLFERSIRLMLYTYVLDFFSTVSV